MSQHCQGRMEQAIRLVLHKTGLYEPVRRLWGKRPDLRLDVDNFGYRVAGAPDGLPIPPARLIRLVQISGEIATFLSGGRLGRASIENALHHNGYHIEQFKRVLDFGCGCGRIMRQWESVSGPRFHGTDLNPELIKWCRAKLGRLADFRTNKLEPPLDYPDSHFDFIYSISVFTHLSEHVQEEWMRELHRVLTANGLLLFTVHGEWRINDLDAEEQARFNSGELVVKYAEVEGSNLCGCYHPQEYVRKHLARDFEVIYYIATGAIDVGQDLYVLRKTG